MYPDPIEQGLARGWKVIDASRLVRDLVLEADVAIVGTGAGGGVTAEILGAAGLSIVMLEEGPLKSTRDFHMLEAEAYRQLYQESASRKTLDNAISILQGRCVGGSTTVNWTSSFRTPPATLAYWQREFGLGALSGDGLLPRFEMMERRLSIAPWHVAPNANNELLRRGAERLGISTGVVRRNVRGCLDLGYCGMGCPTNAKQSMLVTTLPAALERGATLVTRARVQRLARRDERALQIEASGLAAGGIEAGTSRVIVRARHYVLAAGAIGSPAILQRSGVPDPGQLVGARTFLHPTMISAAFLPERVNGYAGAPQALYSDHFLDDVAIDGPIGFKLEVAPLHPVLFGMTLPGFAARHAELMREFSRAQVVLALMRDGFNAESPGGIVGLRRDGSPVLAYPISEFIWRGARRALLAMAEIQFAAGARKVYPVHEDAEGYSSWRAAKAGIERLAMKPRVARVVSAHVMGGCGMADDPRRGVVGVSGRHFHVENLSVHDGSVFPTSLGANPQLSIYALAARNASLLARELTGRPAPVVA
ncbi:MAG: GMC family oxidoreductase [Betaproteobacteria bacterium]|nr:GMC family oxidoreductase [Betaproteobacteria bacterium]